LVSTDDNEVMGTKPKKVSEQIRDAIRKADVSRYRIALDTGITEAALSRFMSRQRGLGMDALDGLAAYFDLELVKRTGK
jgi:hypothetical protein